MNTSAAFSTIVIFIFHGPTLGHVSRHVGTGHMVDHQMKKKGLGKLIITAAQCVRLSLSNVSNWMGDRQRKHCAQLPGEEIGGTLVRDFALSSWGL